LAIGRRGGKSFGILQWILLNSLGLLNGHSVAWVGPSDAIIAEARSWIKSWLEPLITGPSPGSLGYHLINGANIDFWSAAPGAKQPLRSRGYSCCVIDEAAYIVGMRQLVDASIRPALGLAQGKLCFISTPHGRGDFEYYYKEAQKTGLAIHAPSSVNPSFTTKELERLRKITPELDFRQEYLAEFLDREGALLKRDQIRFGIAPEREAFRSLVLGIDIALSSKQRADYTALVVAGVDEINRHWIIHVARWRADWPTTFANILRYFNAWNPHLIMTENVAFQELAIREMMDAGMPVSAIKPSLDKESRFAVVHMQYSMGMVWHNEGLDPDYESELLTFPQSAHDDFVDATVFAVGALNFRIRMGWGVSAGASWGGNLPHEKQKLKVYDALGNCFEGSKLMLPNPEKPDA